MIKKENTLFYLNKKFPSVQNYIYTGFGKIEDFGILKNDGIDNYVYILQDYNNPKLAYRVYKSFKSSTFNSMKEPFFLQELIERGHSIENIDFPHGVVTYKNRIIGQAIPYYEDSHELAYYETEKEFICELLVEVYQQIRELYNHGIYYLDIHGRNFLITTDGMKMIDFDKRLITFKGRNSFLNNYYEKLMVDNFSFMARALLNNQSFNSDRVNTMNDLERKIIHIKKLVKS